MQPVFRFDAGALEKAAADTLEHAADYSPTPFGEAPRLGWLGVDFAAATKTWRESKSVAPGEREHLFAFYEWRAKVLAHEAKEIGKLEHLWRVWDYYRRTPGKGHESMAANLGGFIGPLWLIHFTSFPNWIPFSEIAAKRVREMSPLTPELRAL